MEADRPVQLAALGDPVRWRIVEQLSTRPRSVGVVARLCGLRQPQATKHLQTLERAGLVSSVRAAQRRYYVLDDAALRSVAQALTGFADAVASHRADFDSLDEYVASVDAERLAADRPRWADGQVSTFDRTLASSREIVWRYLTEPDLLAGWWSPTALRLSRIEFDARPGGRIVQEYVDGDDPDGSTGVVGFATGTVVEVDSPGHLAFDLSPLLPDGSVAFTARYDVDLRDDGGATALTVRLAVTGSTIESADFVAGIRLGWNQALDALVTAVATSNTHLEEKS